MIEGYNEAEPTSLRFIMRIIAARIRLQGFIVFDYLPRMDEFYRDMGRLAAERRRSSRARRSSTGWSRCPTRSSACSRARTSARCWSGSRATCRRPGSPLLIAALERIHPLRRACRG